MEYFYSAGAMSYGNGYFWHKFYNFPKLDYVTKSLTLASRFGNPFAISYIPFKKSIWNKNGLRNKGFFEYFFRYGFHRNRAIISISGMDEEIRVMVNFLEKMYSQWKYFFIKGIELNYSCPNIECNNNKYIPKSSFPLYLKLSYNMDPYKYDLTNIKEIRVNSVPVRYGAISGKIAQKYNWPFIEKFNKEGIKVAGCSAVEEDDFKRLEDIGCTNIGLGSIMLINPKVIENLFIDKSLVKEKIRLW
jgi:dihydroorotate dehydrogenase